eukprot:TRINITY_DN12391_c0_g1_i1.p1 TRINITY_DN12391_c0_g1~~TRINITY_DN12391_c0_g1_i1.p1  ORF type:complete len:203 (+),score=60.24 TRINITY_DN12391_c0_g1_i1:115-723(+)
MSAMVIALPLIAENPMRLMEAFEGPLRCVSPWLGPWDSLLCLMVIAYAPQAFRSFIMTMAGIGVDNVDPRAQLLRIIDGPPPAAADGGGEVKQLSPTLTGLVSRLTAAHQNTMEGFIFQFAGVGACIMSRFPDFELVSRLCTLYVYLRCAYTALYIVQGLSPYGYLNSFIATIRSFVWLGSAFISATLLALAGQQTGHLGYP